MPDLQGTPVPQRWRAPSPQELQHLSTQAQQWREKGVVEQCRPLPWVNNIVFAAKKNGGIRVCLDCTPANRVTEEFRWPLPRLQDVRHRLHGYRWFTRLDLRDAFFRITVPNEYRDLLAFRVQDRTYRFVKMPFGVTDGPAVFQRFMDNTLAAHFYYCVWYIDDVLIGADTLPQLRDRVRSVLSDLTRAGCEVNQEKSEYDKHSLLFAGLWLTPSTVGPNLAKVRELLDLPAPRSKQDRQSALGLVSYLRDFIPFASLLTATIGLSAREIDAQPDVAKHWARLLQHVSRYISTVGHWDEKADAELYTDASNLGCGAILIQKGKIISVVSRKFTSVERGRAYDTTARETLGLLLAAQRMRIFLHRDKGVTRVKTDHSALLNRKVEALTPREMRWRIKITTWIRNLEHVPGKKNPADLVSRWGLTFGGCLRV